MSKRRREDRRQRRFLGTFSWPDDQQVVGELRLRGDGTLLRVHSDRFLARIENGASIQGHAYSGEVLTLIDCRSPGTGSTTVRDGPTIYSADVFPHYVAVGHRTLVPSQPCIRAIQFTATDLCALFYDFDAFGHVVDAKSIMDIVLRERRELRPVETGAFPLVSYFTGKERVVGIPTEIGRISVEHRPAYNLGGPQGVYIKNRMAVAIEFLNSICFGDSLDRMHAIVCFLSMAAGRTQGVDEIRLLTSEGRESGEGPLLLHASYPPKLSTKSDSHKPHPADVPFDPINYRVEFEAALADWIRRHSRWRFGRSRYIDCLRKANRYNADRLIAAANMFDLLPEEAVPVPGELSADLASTRDACAAEFRKLPLSIDRNSVLSALARVGKPSLPKKVAFRVAMVESKFGARFPELPMVANLAVKCRNVLVHGSSGDIDYARVEPFIPFLTDALEFIFAASDFIEAGWDAARRNSEGHGWGHNFARFRNEYNPALSQLRAALSA